MRTDDKKGRAVSMMLVMVACLAASTAVRGEDPKEKATRVDGKSRFEVSGDGVEMVMLDGDLELKLGGRLHVDAVLHDEDRASLEDDADVRRARVHLKMAFRKRWSLKSQFELSGSEIEFRDQYLRFSPNKQTDYTVGHFKEPFSLEELSSSNELVFIERSLPVAAFAPGRALGVGFRKSGERTSLAAGVFDGSLVLRGGVDEEDKGLSASVRGTWSPDFGDSGVLHLGLGLSGREIPNGVEPRFRVRPESALTPVRFVNTGRVEGVDELVRLGFEIAAARGPLTVQGEYIVTRLQRSSTAPGSPELSGWYATCSWLFRGKPRTYDPAEGTFGRVRGLKRGGAWEVAARVSSLDFDDLDVEGGQETNFTLGVNWYAHPNIRLMGNLVHVDSERRGETDKPSLLLLRAQVAF